MKQSDKTDEELIYQYQMDNNPSSLDILFSRYLDVGYRTAMRYMRNSSDAEDVLQLAFIQFLKNIHQFREGAVTVKPWLMKMIVNISLTKLAEEKKRKARNHKEGSIRMAEYSKQHNAAEDTNSDLELKQSIQKIVEGLPEKYKSPICLVMYEGFTYSEVANVLSLPEKTIRTQVSRGIEKIKASLGTMGTLLSVDAIVVLMNQTVLDKAPITAQKLTESSQLYQSKFFTNSSENSSRFIAVSKPFYTPFKIIMLSVFTVSFAGLFFFTKTYFSDSSSQPTETVNLNSKQQLSLNNDRTWDFINKSDRDLQLSVGNWEWNENAKGMKSKSDQYLIIDLPYTSQEKPLFVESIIIPNMTKNGEKISLLASACWKNNQEILEHLTYELPKYHLTDLEPISQRTYIYKDYILIFFKEKLLRAKKYTIDTRNTNLALVSKNYIFKKITCKTLDAPTKELSQALDELKDLTPLKASVIPIKDAEIIFGTTNEFKNYYSR